MQEFTKEICSLGAKLCYVIELSTNNIIAFTNSQDKQYVVLLTQNIAWDESMTSIVFQDDKYFVIARDKNQYKVKKGKLVLVLYKHGENVYIFGTANDDESVINKVFEKRIETFQ